MDWVPRIKAESGFQQGTLPVEYLGVPVYQGAERSDMFLFLRDRIARRTQSWSHRYLSFRGRLLLIKSTLTAIPINVLQVLEPTNEVMNQMESMVAKFCWGSTNNTKTIHWISWERICRPIGEGGLGIRKFSDMAEAFGMKLWWRFREQTTLWARFMLHKYCTASGPARPVACKKHSAVWKRMVKASSMTQEKIRWAIGNGQLDFWDDTWLKDHTIRSFCNQQLRLPRHQLKDFWVGNKWDDQRIKTLLIPLGVPSHIIVDILEVPIETSEPDLMRWTLTPHGSFTLSSAWKCTRTQHTRNEDLELNWSPSVSPSISIFAWRLMADRIPVDVKLQRRSIHLASKCRCCANPKIETREHLFINGEGAKIIWRFFADWFPEAPSIMHDQDINNRFKMWSDHMAGAKSGHVQVIIPLLIFWNIWTARNDAIHRGEKFNAEMVINRVVMYLQWSTSAKKLLRTHWSGCSPKVVISFPQVSLRSNLRRVSVKWEAPIAGWVKVNTDGAFSEVLGRAGGGGIVRDCNGGVLEGFAISLNAESAVDAELEAITIGLEVARKWSQQIWIETDAKEVVQMLKNRDRGTATIRHKLAKTRIMIKKYACRISHIYREGNKVADWLAKQGRDRSSIQSFGCESVPRRVKELAFLDQIGLPSVREVTEDDMG